METDNILDFSKEASHPWVDEYGQNPVPSFNVRERIWRDKYGMSETKRGDKMDKRQREDLYNFTYDLSLYIAKHLQHSQTVTELDVSSCGAGDRILTALGKCLAVNQHLRRLKAINLGATGETLVAFAQILEKYNYGLVECEVGQENDNIIAKSANNDNYNSNFVFNIIGADYSEDKKIKEAVERVKAAVATNYKVQQVIPRLRCATKIIIIIQSGYYWCNESGRVASTMARKNAQQNSSPTNGD
jgi:hypothetical protein